MSGRETCISKPSRRIISIRIESCSSPRPSTFICSGVSVGSTRIDTLPSSSLSRRSLIWREVTNWPSRPDIGEVLTPKIIDTVGSSMAMTGIALRCSTSAIVSPMVMSSIPAMQTMSPAAAWSTSTRLRPSKAKSLVILVSWNVPSSLQTVTGSLILTVPLKMRPTAIRPR